MLQQEEIIIIEIVDMMRIYCFLLFLLLSIIHAQESWPPYKISRLFHFTFSESLNYDSNIFQNENDLAEDISANHSLTVSHSDSRPYFAYQLAYVFGWRNYFRYSDRDSDSHSLSAQISIDRPYLNLSIGHSFSITSDPRGLEFDPFTRSTYNTTSMSGQYKFNDSFGMQFSLQYHIQEYTDIPESSSNRITYKISASYQAAQRLSFTAGYEEVISWFTNIDDKSSYDIMRVNVYYKLWENISIYTGTEYTFLNSNNSDDNYYSIPFGVKIFLKQAVDSEFQSLNWLDNIDLSISTNLSNRNFRNPIDFDINASGHITQKTTWSLSASRKLDFSALSNEQQYQTGVSFGIGHMFNELRTQFQLFYQQYEYETDVALEHTGFSFSWGYPIARWVYLNGVYSFKKQISSTVNREYSSHDFSIGTSISF